MSKDFTPHDYQEDIIDWICTHPRCAIWASMGSGKSVSTLTALDRLNLVEDVFPALILAPLRVARSTWPEEAKLWSHLAHLRVSVITGTPKQRERALAEEADIYCTNYDNLVWLRKALGDEWPFKTVVADEFTRLKSYRIRQGGSRARALGQVAHTHVSRFIGLTGTPAPNGVKDLWGQIWFLDKGERLGKTFSAFEQRWFRKGYDGYSLVPYDHTQKEVEDKLRDICLTVQGLQVDEPITSPVYVDLPPMARKVYDEMEKEMFAVLNEEGVEAANAAVRTQKCLAQGTEILTSTGWKPIETYTPGDLLWDGVEWISACDLVCQGYKEVVDCWGVMMTADHKVLTTDGWREAGDINNAEPSERPYRPDFWLPHSYGPRREPEDKRNECEGDMVRQVRVWDRDRNHRSQFAFTNAWAEEVLRVPQGRNAAGRMANARHDWPPCMGYVGKYALALRKPARQGLEKLRSAWGVSLRALADILNLLGRHGSDVPRGLYVGADGQLCGVHAGELSLAFASEASKQPKGECPFTHAYGADDGFASSAPVQDKSGNHLRPDTSGLARKRAADKALVYDIVNAGPRHRFTVRGRDGNPFIVHNCLQLANGALYIDEDGNWETAHDAKLDALESIIEEANGAPVLVAYNFKHDLERLRRRFPKGRVLDADPDTIKQWNAGRISVLFAHPASAGHGLSLQHGGNIIAFFGVDWSLENHMQIIERIGPMRQKQAGYDRPVFVYPILARNTVDDLVMDRLSSKKSVQEVLLEALKRRKGTK